MYKEKIDKSNNKQISKKSKKSFVLNAFTSLDDNINNATQNSDIRD